MDKCKPLPPSSSTLLTLRKNPLMSSAHTVPEINPFPIGYGKFHTTQSKLLTFVLRVGFSVLASCVASTACKTLTPLLACNSARFASALQYVAQTSFRQGLKIVHFSLQPALFLSPKPRSVHHQKCSGQDEKWTSVSSASRLSRDVAVMCALCPRRRGLHSFTFRLIVSTFVGYAG